MLCLSINIAVCTHAVVIHWEPLGDFSLCLGLLQVILFETYPPVFLFQFVDFSILMSKPGNKEQKDMTFALAALMEIPFQYQAVLDLGICGSDQHMLNSLFLNFVLRLSSRRYIGRIPPLKPLPPPPTVQAADAKLFAEHGSTSSLISSQSVGKKGGSFSAGRR